MRKMLLFMAFIVCGSVSTDFANAVIPKEVFKNKQDFKDFQSKVKNLLTLSDNKNSKELGVLVPNLQKTELGKNYIKNPSDDSAKCIQLALAGDIEPALKDTQKDAALKKIEETLKVDKKKALECYNEIGKIFSKKTLLLNEMIKNNPSFLTKTYSENDYKSCNGILSSISDECRLVLGDKTRENIDDAEKAYKLLDKRGSLIVQILKKVMSSRTSDIRSFIKQNRADSVVAKMDVEDSVGFYIVDELLAGSSYSSFEEALNKTLPKCHRELAGVK